ncbi:MAG: VWA domain-containing protein [Acidobacteriota bacterium]
MQRYLSCLLAWLLVVGILGVAGRAQSGRNRPDPHPHTRNTDSANGNSRSVSPNTPAANSTPIKIEKADPGDESAGGEAETLKIDATLVTVPVVVSDYNGRYVPFLKQEDFKLFEDSVTQEISFFASERVPFAVSLVMDTSGSIESSMEDIRESAIRFVRELREDDRVMVIEFNSKVEVLTELTSDRNKIRSAIRSTRAGGGTKLYEGLYEAAKRMKSEEGRKAIILLTDGEDTESRRVNAEQALEAVVESGALMYVIQFPESLSSYSAGPTIGMPPTFPGSGGGRRTSGPGGYPDSAFLRELVKLTGGDMYFAGGRAGLPNIWRRIAEELRFVYVLGYYPSNAVENGGFRQIRVQLRERDNGSIRHKQGYTAKRPKKA